jgi:hypothetical protein
MAWMYGLGLSALQTIEWLLQIPGLGPDPSGWQILLALLTTAGGVFGITKWAEGAARTREQKRKDAAEATSAELGTGMQGINIQRAQIEVKQLEFDTYEQRMEFLAGELKATQSELREVRLRFSRFERFARQLMRRYDELEMSVVREGDEAASRILGRVKTSLPDPSLLEDTGNNGGSIVMANGQAIQKGNGDNPGNGEKKALREGGQEPPAKQ